MCGVFEVGIPECGWSHMSSTQTVFHFCIESGFWFTRSLLSANHHAVLNATSTGHTSTLNFLFDSSIFTRRLTMEAAWTNFLSLFLSYAFQYLWYIVSSLIQILFDIVYPSFPLSLGAGRGLYHISSTKGLSVGMYWQSVMEMPYRRFLGFLIGALRIGDTHRSTAKIDINHI